MPWRIPCRVRSAVHTRCCFEVRQRKVPLLRSRRQLCCRGPQHVDSPIPPICDVHVPGIRCRSPVNDFQSAGHSGTGASVHGQTCPCRYTPYLVPDQNPVRDAEPGTSNSATSYRKAKPTGATTPTSHPRSEWWIVSLSVLFGTVAWAADAFADSVVFHQGTLLHQLFKAVSPSELYVRVSAAVGFIVFGLIISRSFGRRRRAEAALHESEERLRAVIENLPMMISAYDENGRVLVRNKEYQRVTGYGTDEIQTADDAYLTLYPDKEYREQILKLLPSRTGNYRNWELEIRTKNGEKRVVSWSDESGRLVIPGWSIWGIGIDVTEKKRAEELLHALLAGVPDAVLHQTGAGVEYVSDNVEAVLGYTAQEMMNDRALFPHLIHPDDAPGLDRAFRDWLTAGATGIHESEFRCRRRDGAYIWLLDRTRLAFRTPEGRCSTLGVFVDITRQREAEAELSRHRQRFTEMVEERTAELKQVQERLIAQEKLAMLGQVSGSIAHELRNPMGAVRNAAFFLRRSASDRLGDKETRHLDIMDNEIDQCDRIIESLLDYARGRKCEPRPCSVRGIVAQAAREVALPERIELDIRIPGNVPHVHADEGQIVRVLGNLLTNAAQAMPDSGRVTVFASCEDGRVSIAVADTGPGIEPTDLGRVFEPLFTTRKLGIGLGLAICKSFVEANSGMIAVESVPGQGTTFTVTLPAA